MLNQWSGRDDRLLSLSHHPRRFAATPVFAGTLDTSERLVGYLQRYRSI
jgi:hypothetical protein